MALFPSSAYVSEGQKRYLDLTALYLTHYKKLAAYIRKQHNVIDAEDIVQELFERLANSRSAHHVRRPSTYLLQPLGM